jgi:hypothetical protein
LIIIAPVLFAGPEDIRMYLLSKSFRSVSLLLIMCLGITCITIPTAQAGLVSTQAALAQQNVRHDRDRLQNLLARAEVRAGLQAHGVDPAQVQARVSSLSDDEAQQLATQLDLMPAGGDGLELVLLIFILLLITDIAGITHIFNGVHHKR